MKNFFVELFQNNLLLIAMLSWIIAQGIKYLRQVVFFHSVNLKILTESGGFPSSHSALVSSVSVALGRIYSFSSPVFAAASVFAFIVMYDATGVRRSTGEQAILLNKIVDALSIERENKKQIKEVLGHTPFEVFAGALIGILLGALMPL